MKQERVLTLSIRSLCEQDGVRFSTYGDELGFHVHLLKDGKERTVSVTTMEIQALGEQIYALILERVNDALWQLGADGLVVGRAGNPRSRIRKAS